MLTIRLTLTQVPLGEHRLPPFQDLIISLSGLTSERKARASKVVAEGGGATEAVLTRSCTHLVFVEPNDAAMPPAERKPIAKYKCARAPDSRVSGG